MNREIHPNRSVRYILLSLAFLAGATAGYFMDGMLPAVRYFLTPRSLTYPSVLASFLPGTYGGAISAALQCTSGTAAELIFWLIGGLAAFPLLLPMAACRGICCGLALAALLGETSVLAGGSILPLLGYGLVSVLLIGFGGVLPAGSLRRRNGWQGKLAVTFLTLAGAVCWITLICGQAGML